MTERMRRLGASFLRWWSVQTRGRRSAWIALGVAGILVLGGTQAAHRDEEENRATLRDVRAAEIEDTIAALERSKVEFESTLLPSGRLRITVATEDRSRAEAAIRGASKGKADGAPDRAGGSWSSFLSPGLVSDPDERRDEEARCRVEEMIRVHPKIDQAIVMFNREEPPLFRGDRPLRTTASVRLVLAEGVARLDPVEAQSIRELVGGALGIDEENVKVFDQERSYGRLLAPLESIETEERIGHEIETRVDSLFAGAFRPDEYRTQVIVKVGEPADTAGGVENPEGESRDLEGTIESVRAITVNVLLDASALHRVVRATRDALGRGTDADRVGASDIDRYIEEQGALVASLVPYPREIATVSVVPRLLRASPVEAIVAPSRTARPRGVEPDALEWRSRPAGDWRLATELFSEWEKWIADPRRRTVTFAALSAVGLLLVAGCAGFVWKRGARRRRSKATLERGIERICHFAIEIGRDVNDLVRSSPDAAFAVVRCWLAGETEKFDGRSFDAESSGDDGEERSAVPEEDLELESDRDVESEARDVALTSAS